MAKIDVKIATQNCHFSKNQCIYLHSCITSVPIRLFTLVTQLSKSVEKNLGHQGLLNFCLKHSMTLRGHSKWHFEHNSRHKQTKLLSWRPYSVFGRWKWIVKAKSVWLFRITLTLTVQLLLKDFRSNKKRKNYFLWKPSTVDFVIATASCKRPPSMITYDCKKTIARISQKFSFKKRWPNMLTDYRSWLKKDGCNTICS